MSSVREYIGKERYDLISTSGGGWNLTPAWNEVAHPYFGDVIVIDITPSEDVSIGNLNVDDLKIVGPNNDSIGISPVMKRFGLKGEPVLYFKVIGSKEADVKLDLQYKGEVVASTNVSIVKSDTNPSPYYPYALADVRELGISEEFHSKSLVDMPFRIITEHTVDKVSLAGQLPDVELVDRDGKSLEFKVSPLKQTETGLLVGTQFLVSFKEVGVYNLILKSGELNEPIGNPVTVIDGDFDEVLSSGDIYVDSFTVVDEEVPTNGFVILCIESDDEVNHLNLTLENPDGDTLEIPFESIELLPAEPGENTRLLVDLDGVGSEEGMYCILYTSTEPKELCFRAKDKPLLTPGVDLNETDDIELVIDSKKLYGFQGESTPFVLGIKVQTPDGSPTYISRNSTVVLDNGNNPFVGTKSQELHCLGPGRYSLLVTPKNYRIDDEYDLLVNGKKLDTVTIETQKGFTWTNDVPTRNATPNSSFVSLSKEEDWVAGNLVEVLFTVKSKEDELSHLPSVDSVSVKTDGKVAVTNRTEVRPGVYLLTLLVKEPSGSIKGIITGTDIESVDSVEWDGDGPSFEEVLSSDCTVAKEAALALANSPCGDWDGLTFEEGTIDGIKYLDSKDEFTSLGIYLEWVRDEDSDVIAHANDDDEEGISGPSVTRSKLVRYAYLYPGAYFTDEIKESLGDIDLPAIVGRQTITYTECDLITSMDEYEPPKIETEYFDSVVSDEELYWEWVKGHIERNEVMLQFVDSMEEKTIFGEYTYMETTDKGEPLYIEFKITDFDEYKGFTIEKYLNKGESYNDELGVVEFPILLETSVVESYPYDPDIEWRIPKITTKTEDLSEDPNEILRKKLAEKREKCVSDNTEAYEKFLEEISYTYENELFMDKYLYRNGGSYDSEEPVYLEWVVDKQRNPAEEVTVAKCYLRKTKNYDNSWRGFEFPIHLCTATFTPQVCSLLELEDDYLPPTSKFDTNEFEDPGLEFDKELQDKVRDCRERNMEELAYFNMSLMLPYERGKLFDKYPYISDGDETSSEPVYLTWEIERGEDRAEDKVVARKVFKKTRNYDGSWIGFRFPVLVEELIYEPLACSLMGYDDEYRIPNITRIVHEIEDEGAELTEELKNLVEHCKVKNKEAYLKVMEDLKLEYSKELLFDKYVYAKGGTRQSQEPVYLAWEITDHDTDVESAFVAELAFRKTRNYDGSWVDFEFPVVKSRLEYNPVVCSLLDYGDEYNEPDLVWDHKEVEDPNPTPPLPSPEEMEEMAKENARKCREANSKHYHEFVDKLKLPGETKFLFDRFAYIDGGDKTTKLPVYTTWQIENSGNFLESPTVFKKVFLRSDNYDCSWDDFKFPIVEKTIIYTPQACSLMEWDDEYVEPQIDSKDHTIWDPDDPNMVPDPEPEYPCNPDPDPENPGGSTPELDKHACPLRCHLIGLKPGQPEPKPDMEIYDPETGVCACKYKALHQ